MLRLKSKLLSLNAGKPANQKTKVFSPANCEELRIPIRMDKTAKVVGKLAERIRLTHPITASSDSTTNGDTDSKKNKSVDAENEDTLPTDGQILSGVLVQNDLKLSLMDPEDLREYAGLTTTTITCRQKLTLASASVELIRWALEGTFGGIADLSNQDKKDSTTTNDILKEDPDAAKQAKPEFDDDDEEDFEPADEEISRPEYKFLVMDTVTVRYRNRGEIEVEWEGNMMNDGIADAVLAVLLTVESSPAAVKRMFLILLFISLPHLPSSNHIRNPSLTPNPTPDSSKLHSHTHQSNGTNDTKPSLSPPHNPHTNTTPAQRLSRLLLFLESQFGSENITPIAKPRLLPPTTTDTDPTPDSPSSSSSLSEDEKDDLNDEAAELLRLTKLGIPLPGLQIRIDKHEATVWLEDLAVECGNAVVRDRVARVVERALECVAGLWGGVGGGGD